MGNVRDPCVARHDCIGSFQQQQSLELEASGTEYAAEIGGRDQGDRFKDFDAHYHPTAFNYRPVENIF
eukprot:1790710-Amphidinium_carterae.1